MKVSEATISMHRRFLYAFIGGLLSLGAPVGLLAVRLVAGRKRQGWISFGSAVRQLSRDPAAFTYVATSTALAFGFFGYALGRQADRLARLSETDSLTGLSNARGLFRRLDAELARSRRYREPLALLVVDLDGLKRINDSYGHRTGDEALRTLADVIRSELRQADLGARWGGDEFAIVAPETSHEAALALAGRVRALISEQHVPEPLSVSIGVTTVDPHRDQDVPDSPELMRAADVAMYEAKKSGRNTVATAWWKDASGRSARRFC